MRVGPSSARGAYPSPRCETPLPRAHVDIAVWKSTSGALRHRSDAVLAQWLISTQVDRAERRRRHDERFTGKDGLLVRRGMYQQGHDFG